MVLNSWYQADMSLYSNRYLFDRQPHISRKTMLFNIYVGVLSQQLNNVIVWCCMNGKVINHLYYADDLVLLSPSTHEMQMLLNECEKYASKYGSMKIRMLYSTLRE